MITSAARQKIASLLQVGGYSGVKINISPSSFLSFKTFSRASGNGIIVNADPLIVIDEGALLLDNLLIDYDAEAREFVIRR